MTVEVETVARELATSTPAFPGYQSYRDSGIPWLGEIPEQWQVQRLKFNSYMKGRIGWQNLRSDEFTDEGPFLVTGMHFVNGGVDWDSCYHISLARYDMAPEIQLRDEDILLTKDGSVGKVAYIHQLPAPASLNSHLLVIRPSRGQYAPRFLYHVLCSTAFRYHILETQTGTTFFGITQESVANFPMLLPPLTEQRAIAAFLDRETARIDALVAAKERLIALLQEKRAALISHAVTHGLDANVLTKDSGVPWLGYVPAHWQIAKLNWLCMSVRDGTHAPPPAVPGVHRLLSARNIVGSDFVLRDDDRTMAPEDFAELERSYTVRCCDVVMAIVGATTGKSAIVGEIENVSVQRSIAILRPHPKHLISGFLNYWLQSAFVQNEIRSIMEKYAAQPGIYLEDVAALRIPALGLREQTTIVAYLDRETAKLDALIARIRQHIEKVKEYRAAIISAAVTGKIDVRSEEHAHE